LGKAQDAQPTQIEMVQHLILGKIKKGKGFRSPFTKMHEPYG
jgi:hypothetical protein